MESFDTRALSNESLLIRDGISHPSSFDVMFNNIAKTFRIPSLNESCQPDDVNNTSHCSDTMKSNFNNHIHNLTMTTSSLLNTSIFSHVTARPFKTPHTESLHHKLQTLKNERLEQQNLTMNSTFLKSSLMVDDIFDKAKNGAISPNDNMSPAKDEDSVLNVDEDFPCEESQEVVLGASGKTEKSSNDKENEIKAHSVESKAELSKVPGDSTRHPVFKEKRLNRQTPKMAQLIKNNSKLSRLKIAFKPAVELSDWIIRPLPDSLGVCVEGKKDGMSDFWHSTAITEAKTKRLVMTASGSEYLLEGNINELCTINSGFTADMAKAFIHGFPKDWKKLIKEFFANLEESIPMYEEVSPVKNTVTREKNEQRKTEAKKISKTAPSKGKRKKIVTEKMSKATSKSIARINEEDLDSVLTPVGLVKKSLATASVTVTRSGRLSLPPLARWSGQKYILRNSEICVDFETSDARRAVMEETKAIYKLSKNHQKMIGCRNSMCLSPSTSHETPTVRLENKKSPSFASSNSAEKLKRSVNKVSMKGKVVGKKAQRERQRSSDTFPKMHSKGLHSERKRRKDSHKCNKSRAKSSSQEKNKKTSKPENRIDNSKSKAASRVSDRNVIKECSVQLEKTRLSREQTHSVQIKKNKKTKRLKKEKVITDVTNTKDVNRTPRVPSRPQISLKAVDATPKSTGSSKILKKRRLNADECVEDSWSDHEKDCLQRAVRDVNSGSSDFWNEVAAIVKTRSPDECQLYHTNYLEDKTASKLSKSKGKSHTVPGRQKGDPIKGKRGTLKRKKEIRAFLDEQNEGYEDNLFDGTPFISRKPISSLIDKIGFDKGDDEIFGANCNFFTPLPGHSKFMSPQSSLRVPFASTKKTPTGLGSMSDSPSIAKRLCADKYIHTFAENKKKISTGAENNSLSTKGSDLQDGLLPKKSLFSPAEKASIFLVGDKENDDLHDDDEEDNQYMYYWNDLDCSQ